MSLSDYAIIESTLREGEQFVNAFFTTEQKIRIATLLDAFGVEYLELTARIKAEADLRSLTLDHVDRLLREAAGVPGELAEVTR